MPVLAPDPPGGVLFNNEADGAFGGSRIWRRKRRCGWRQGLRPTPAKERRHRLAAYRPCWGDQGESSVVRGQSMTLEPCVGCGGLFPPLDGSTHRYLESSPACAAACGRLFAQHYERMDLYGHVYRLANDAYAVQHPGQRSPATTNSAAIHLIRLCLVFEHALPPAHANAAVLSVGQRKHSYVWLEPPASRGLITVADFSENMAVEEHCRLLRQWALRAWEAWSLHRETIRGWLPPEWRRYR
jgi:hypothetical protein